MYATQDITNRFEATENNYIFTGDEDKMQFDDLQAMLGNMLQHASPYQAFALGAAYATGLQHGLQGQSQAGYKATPSVRPPGKSRYLNHVAAPKSAASYAGRFPQAGYAPQMPGLNEQLNPYKPKQYGAMQTAGMYQRGMS